MTSGGERPAVVVGVDGSDSALGGAQWAADYAAKHSLPLTLLHAIPRLDWHFTNAEHHVDPPGADGDRVLAVAADAVRARHPDLVIQTEIVRGAVASTLAEAAESARLLVVGSGAAEHRALGGDAVRVAHRASCPVVVWRPPVAKRTGKPLPVVVGVDESEASRDALEEAFDFARTLRAPLTVAHMWEIAAAVGMGDLGGQSNMDWPLLEMLESTQRRQLEAMVGPLASQHPGAHVTQIFQDATPAKGLTELSREAQLVVVGSQGRGRLAGALLGSVSQTLIHHAQCPVLVVRERIAEAADL